jgi:protein O-mannosyl-transferase
MGKEKKTIKEAYSSTTGKKGVVSFSATKATLLLGIIAFLVYANTLKNDYAIDDFLVLKRNSFVTRGVAGLPQIFTNSYLKGAIVSPSDHYKPLSLALFAVGYSLRGDDPAFFHLLNILLFAGCVMLLFIFLNDLLDKTRPAVAFVAALLFAVHPVNTETVANIKSCDQVLCFFFGFLSLLVFLRYMRQGKIAWLIAGALLFFLSLISKETTVTFLAVIPLVFFFYKKDSTQRAVFITASAVAFSAIFLLIRHSILSAGHPGVKEGITLIDNALLGAPSLSSRLATAVMMLGYYLKLLIIPYPLVCDYSYNTIPYVTFADWRVLLSLALYIALAAIGIYRFVKYSSDPFAFAIFFFLVTLSVCANIFVLVGATMAERFLFFPSVGFCLAIALLVVNWVDGGPVQGLDLITNRKLLVVALPLALICAALTTSRNSDWQNNYTLLMTDVKKVPRNSRLLFNLGTTILISSEEQVDPAEKKQTMDEGISYIQKAISIYPDLDLAISELGNAYMTINNYDSAEVYNRKYLTKHPADTVALQNLAAVYFRTKRYRESLDLCLRFVSQFPGQPRGYRNEGNCYLVMGKYDSAVVAYKKAISLDPGNNASYERLALAYKYLGNADSAKKYEIYTRQPLQYR